MLRTYSFCMIAVVSCALITGCGGDDSSGSNTTDPVSTPVPDSFDMSFISASNPTLDQTIALAGTATTVVSLPVSGSFTIKAFENNTTINNATAHLLNKSYDIQGAGQSITLSQQYYFNDEGFLIAYQFDNGSQYTISSPQSVPSQAKDGDNGTYLENTTTAGETTKITWAFTQTSSDAGVITLTGSVTDANNALTQNFTENYTFTKNGTIESYNYSATVNVDGQTIEVKLQ